MDLFTNIKPINTKIYEDMGTNEIIFNEKLNDDFTVKYYNDLLMQAIDKQNKVVQTAYLTKDGIRNLKIKMTGKDPEYEKMLKASKEFSKKMREATVGIK